MDSQLHILDAKREYMTRLSADVAPFIEARFKQMYDEALVEKKSKALQVFQRKLKEVPLWNEQTVQTMTTTIENHLAIKRNAKTQYLSSLIAMAFVSYLKIMSSCRLNQQKKPPQMRLKLPSNGKFLHRSFVEAARLYYENPYIIRQPQVKQLEVVAKGVETAVRELIPMEDILDVYLQDCVDDSQTVPPILSPVQSDDEEEGEEANDDAFPMAFRSDKMDDDHSDDYAGGEPTHIDERKIIDTDDVFEQPPPAVPVAPYPPQVPAPTAPAVPTAPTAPTPPAVPVAPPTGEPVSDIPTAYEYRQSRQSAAPSSPPPSPIDRPQQHQAPPQSSQAQIAQQRIQSQLYNDASDDDDFH
jgi:hypothetical protein